ncbi:hypothetical protein QL285_038607 [Trifolium repens]|nr:hypothetical protein QL285_038607 [Trifolium repens]
MTTFSLVGNCTTKTSGSSMIDQCPKNFRVNIHSTRAPRIIEGNNDGTSLGNPGQAAWACILKVRILVVLLKALAWILHLMLDRWGLSFPLSLLMTNKMKSFMDSM